MNDLLSGVGRARAYTFLVLHPLATHPKTKGWEKSIRLYIYSLCFHLKNHSNKYIRVLGRGKSPAHMLYLPKPLRQIQPNKLSYMLTQVGRSSCLKWVKTSLIITSKIGRNLVINSTKREDVNSSTFQHVMRSQYTHPGKFAFPVLYYCGEGMSNFLYMVKYGCATKKPPFQLCQIYE